MSCLVSLRATRPSVSREEPYSREHLNHWKEPAWTGGGGSHSWPGQEGAIAAWTQVLGEQERSRRNPLLQAKLKMAGQACVSHKCPKAHSPQNWLALLGSHCSNRTMDGSLLAPLMNSSRDSLPSLFVSICLKILSVRFSGVDSSSGIFITEDTIL